MNDEIISTKPDVCSANANVANELSEQQTSPLEKQMLQSDYDGDAHPLDTSTDGNHLDASSSFIPNINSNSIVPINPFDDENNIAFGDERLSESKCRLDDMFQNESLSDNVMPIQQVRCSSNSKEEGVAGKTVTDESSKNDEHNEKNNRNTTSTKTESVWDENDNDEDDNMSNNSNAPSFGSHNNNRYTYFILRIIHRICHPHIHPPCSRSRLPNNAHHMFKCCDNNRIPPNKRRIICRSLIIIFMIITITFTLLDLLILHQYLHVWLDSTLAWLQTNPVSGGLAFIGIFLLGSLCFFPVALLSLGAGYVYIELYGLGLGIFVAFIVCYFGCLLGASVCFARSRYLMRQLIERFSVRYPIVRAVDRAFESMGFRLFLLLRLSPAMPFNALVSYDCLFILFFLNMQFSQVFFLSFSTLSHRIILEVSQPLVFVITGGPQCE